jgi:hypothetical protein
MDEDNDDCVVVGATTRRRESLPLEPATKEEVMDFNEDCSSETEFNEDCSSETEFDVDAVDFDGNDTNVFFIVKPFDDAAKKAE